jgi:hypothetical protein
MDMAPGHLRIWMTSFLMRKEREKIPDVTLNDYGLRNQNGPVDQYNFRDIYERRWSKPVGYPKDEDDDWREWDRARSVSASNLNGYPGASGKTREGRKWFNHSQNEQKRNFVGKGPKGYRRSDNRVYEEVCETLLRSPDVDAHQVSVRVNEGTVVLEGWVDGRQAKKIAEYIIEDLPGVEDVRNELLIVRPQDYNNGPAAVTRKDLGIQNRNDDT